MAALVSPALKGQLKSMLSPFTMWLVSAIAGRGEAEHSVNSVWPLVWCHFMGEHGSCSSIVPFFFTPTVSILFVTKRKSLVTTAFPSLSQRQYSKDYDYSPCRER